MIQRLRGRPIVLGFLIEAIFKTFCKLAGLLVRIGSIDVASPTFSIYKSPWKPCSCLCVDSLHNGTGTRDCYRRRPGNNPRVGVTEMEAVISTVITTKRSNCHRHLSAMQNYSNLQCETIIFPWRVETSLSIPLNQNSYYRYVPVLVLVSYLVCLYQVLRIIVKTNQWPTMRTHYSWLALVNCRHLQEHPRNSVWNAT